MAVDPTAAITATPLTTPGAAPTGADPILMAAAANYFRPGTGARVISRNARSTIRLNNNPEVRQFMQGLGLLDATGKPDTARIQALQTSLGVTPDGKFGPLTFAAYAATQGFTPNATPGVTPGVTPGAATAVLPGSVPLGVDLDRQVTATPTVVTPTGVTPVDATTRGSVPLGVTF